MRKKAIREHLKLLIHIRINWNWLVSNSSGFYSGKVRIMTRDKELFVNKEQLELHIERTKKNLARCA